MLMLGFKWGALLALLTVIVWSDIRRRRVANGPIVAAFVAGLILRLVDEGWGATANGLAAAAIVLVGLWLPWKKRMLGGADVKLATACAAWVGVGGLVVFLLASAMAGGLLAAGVWVRASTLQRSAIHVRVVEMRLGKTAGDGSTPTVPYTAAIAIAAALTLGYLGMAS